jgi:uncharacterized protein
MTDSAKNKKKLVGFAAMSPERRFEISQKAGKKAHELGKAHKFTPAEASAAGKKGGATTRVRYSKSA